MSFLSMPAAIIKPNQPIVTSTLINGLIGWWNLGPSQGDEYFGGNAFSGSSAVVDNWTICSGNNFSQSGHIACLGDHDLYGCITVDVSLTNGEILGIYKHNDNRRCWALKTYEFYGAVYLTISSDGSYRWGNTVAEVYQPVAPNTPTLIEWYHDSVNNRIAISANGGNFITESWSKGIYSPSSPPPLLVGNTAGKIKRLGLWNRILTPEERSQLYTFAS